ncbi:unnamed protein product [Prunus armeniaca]
MCRRDILPITFLSQKLRTSLLESWVDSSKRPVAPQSSFTGGALCQNNWLLCPTDQSLYPHLPLIETLCQNDQSPMENDLSTPHYQNQVEETELCFEILPAPDLPTSLVPCQSLAEEVIQLADIFVPNSVTEALKDSKWKEAMNEEMRALQKKATWELVHLPY